MYKCARFILPYKVVLRCKVYWDDLPDKFDLDSEVWELTLDVHCVIFIHFLPTYTRRYEYHASWRQVVGRYLPITYT